MIVSWIGSSYARAVLYSSSVPLLAFVSRLMQLSGIEGQVARLSPMAMRTSGLHHGMLLNTDSPFHAGRFHLALLAPGWKKYWLRIWLQSKEQIEP